MHLRIGKKVELQIEMKIQLENENKTILKIVQKSP